MARPVTLPWLWVVALFGALTFAPTHSLLDSHFASGGALQTASWDAIVSVELAEEFEEDTQSHTIVGANDSSISAEFLRPVETFASAAAVTNRKYPLRRTLRSNCCPRGPPVLS